MKIWLINHYAVPPQYYPLARPSLFAKHLIKKGHDVTIIAASTVHNSKGYNLIDNNNRVKRIMDDGIPYVLINCRAYEGNGFGRIINILQFAQRLPNVLNSLEPPDAIVATSFDPFTCYSGIKYAKKNGIKAISEIADLWPETLAAYTRIGKNNPVVRLLRLIEKKIYMLSDAIVFTMDGAYDYIKEQNWQDIIPKEKVNYINNGIDLDLFNYNRDHFQIMDADLKNADIFKVVYTGSIRKVNNLGLLLDVAKLVREPRIRFLIWGAGDELEYLQKRVSNENITNVIFKGRVDKKYVPYITSSADLNFAHNGQSKMFRYGISFNKMFDYLASGRPILCDFDSNYNPAIEANAGREVKSANPVEIAQAIEDFCNMDSESLQVYSYNALKAAKLFDFEVLTERLENIIERA